MKRRNIFISYRRRDLSGNISGTDIARTIKQHLEISGYKNRVFFDYSELSDDEFEHKILREIERCKVFVLVLTHDTMYRCVNEDDWVRREILHAIRHDVKIIPIEIDDHFNGYPEGMCEELNIIKRLHHSKVHTDSSFESDMDSVIEKRIKPVLAPPKPLNYKRWFITLLSIVLFIIALFTIAIVSSDDNESTEEVDIDKEYYYTQIPSRKATSKDIKLIADDVQGLNLKCPLEMEEHIILSTMYVEDRDIAYEYMLTELDTRGMSGDDIDEIKQLARATLDAELTTTCSAIASLYMQGKDLFTNTAIECGYNYVYKYYDANRSYFATSTITNEEIRASIAEMMYNAAN